LSTERQNRFQRRGSIENAISLDRGECTVQASQAPWASRLRKGAVVAPLLLAPDPRFAHALFLCFAMAASLLLLTSIPQGRFVLVFCPMLVATNLAPVLQNGPASAKRSGASPPPTGSRSRRGNSYGARPPAD
jgi:hypothetical protein